MFTSMHRSESLLIEMKRFAEAISMCVNYLNAIEAITRQINVQKKSKKEAEHPGSINKKILTLVADKFHRINSILYIFFLQIFS